MTTEEMDAFLGVFTSRDFKVIFASPSTLLAWTTMGTFKKAQIHALVHRLEEIGAQLPSDELDALRTLHPYPDEPTAAWNNMRVATGLVDKRLATWTNDNPGGLLQITPKGYAVRLAPRVLVRWAL